MESLDSKDEKTLLLAKGPRARRGGSWLGLWQDDPEETPTIGLEGHSSCPCLGRATSRAAEVPAPRPIFAFLLEGDA